MKILFENNLPIPVRTYGGTERILYWLMKELVRLGHEVYLVGNPLSQVESIGVKLIPKSDPHNWKHLIPKDIDIVHFFVSPPFEYDGKFVVTIHGNGRPGEVFHKNTIFLSKKHAANHNASCFVYNGIDFEEYPWEPGPNFGWDNFLFLAKAKWKVKNVRDAARVCQNNKKHLHIAGGRILTFSKFIHNYGMVDQKQKLDLTRKCDALVFPVRWHEPFGLAVIEAMSQGRPVIGSSFGSLPELINPDVGIICKNYQELNDAIRGDHKFNPETIRNWAESNFSSKQMALNYLSCYQKVLEGESLNIEVPRYLSEVPADELLAF